MSREQGTQTLDRQVDAKFNGGHQATPNSSLGEALP